MIGPGSQPGAGPKGPSDMPEVTRGASSGEADRGGRRGPPGRPAGYRDGVTAPGPASRDRPDHRWVRPWAPTAVAACGPTLAFAGLGLYVTSGNLPVVLAAGLTGLLLVLVVGERGPFADPRACTDAAVIVAFGSTALALVCGLVVSVQRATWADGRPVGWWVHALVALGLVAVTGAASFAATALSFLVNVDAAFLGGNWATLGGVVVALLRIWNGHDGVWVALVWGVLVAVVAGPFLTALLRVHLVWPRAEGWAAPGTS